MGPELVWGSMEAGSEASKQILKSNLSTTEPGLSGLVRASERQASPYHDHTTKLLKYAPANRIDFTVGALDHRKALPDQDSLE
jgi:hypothetical protein